MSINAKRWRVSSHRCMALRCALHFEDLVAVLGLVGFCTPGLVLHWVQTVMICVCSWMRQGHATWPRTWLALASATPPLPSSVPPACCATRSCSALLTGEEAAQWVWPARQCIVWRAGGAWQVWGPLGHRRLHCLPRHQFHAVDCAQ